MPHRTLAVAVALLGLAACAGRSEPPVGVSTAPLDEPSGRSEAPPEGGAGHVFGESAQDARARCAAEQGAWEQRGRAGACTETSAAAGARRVTILEYCDGAVCRIHTLVTLQQPDAQAWLGAYEHLRRELERRFGTPDDRETRFPAACESDFAACVRSGSAGALLRWRWQDGHAVMLRVGALGEVPAAVSISYASPAGSRKTD